MGQTVRDLLLETLEELGEKQFKKFKGKLNDWEVNAGYKVIPKCRLEKADEDDVADLIISFYAETYGIEVTLGVLEAIGEMKHHGKLRKSWQEVAAPTPSVKPEAGNERVTPTVGQSFVDKHRAALITRMSHIDPVLDNLLDNKILTDEQYDTVRSNRTSQEKMRQLYDYVRSWGRDEKERFYQYLLKHNKPLIKDLEMNS
ncbi:PYD and CARD domain containing L homeolog [Xenopus laevis]|uniref:MGC84339 protein n=1 Tax=Xenopus laevis TaxID=8355 RepID=Q6DJG0_XENLA|nr:PYD and CARD domain containing L homeolog [Xenopus laevis]AAH75219.1 MGC84339 protein [Xenopus laevis]